MKPNFDKVSAAEREAIMKAADEVEQYKREHPEWLSHMKTAEQFKTEIRDWLRAAVPEVKPTE